MRPFKVSLNFAFMVTQGIIPNSFAHIFGVIAKAEGSTKFLVRVSYLEIYCEDVKDREFHMNSVTF